MAIFFYPFGWFLSVRGVGLSCPFSTPFLRCGEAGPPRRWRPQTATQEPYEMAIPRENLQKERGGLISLRFVDFFAKTQQKEEKCRGAPCLSSFCSSFEKDADTSPESYEVATPCKSEKVPPFSLRLPIFRENLQKERGGLISLRFVEFCAKTQQKGEKSRAAPCLSSAGEVSRKMPTHRQNLTRWRRHGKTFKKSAAA